MGIDLDEARIARREASKRAPTLKFGGNTYELPFELPIEAVMAMGRLGEASKVKDGSAITKALLEVMHEMMAEDVYKKFMAINPSVNDLSAIVAGIPSEYGIGSGESKGSDSPSTDTTERPKRPSKPATE